MWVLLLSFLGCGKHIFVAYPQYRPPVSDFAQTVKQQADIVKVIEGYIRLRKAGAQNYSGLCPFHKEKSPSFSVHAVRQFYHCFGCQARATCSASSAKLRTSPSPRRCGSSRRSAAFRCPSASFPRRKRPPERACAAKLLELHETATAWFEEQLRGPKAPWRANTWPAAD
jgi:DNA primase